MVSWMVSWPTCQFIVGEDAILTHLSMGLNQRASNGYFPPVSGAFISRNSAGSTLMNLRS
jgi:hypothetical protein